MLHFLSLPSPRVLPSSLLILVVLLLCSASVWAQPKTLAVLPFEIHASEDYGHLKNAVPDMFASRVAQARGYRLFSESRIKDLEIDPARLDQDLALDMGREAGADVVVYGSLTMLEDSWSLDATLLSVAEEELLDSYSRSGSQIQDLIPGLEDVAKEMRSTLEEDAGQVQKRAEARKEAEPGKEQEGPYAGFEVAHPNRTDIPGAWSGPEMQKRLTGLAAGDVNGDGDTETVLVDESQVYIYSLKDNRFQELDSIQAPGNASCLSVDVGDINDNGRAEIFVTAKNNQGTRLSSFVLEQDNSEFTRIAEKEPWFYQVVQDPEQGQILLGQKHSSEADPFQADVVRLEHGEDGYAPGGTFAAGSNRLNVLGMSQGKIQGESAGPNTVGLDSKDRLQVLDQEGKGIWSSKESYGPSSLFLEGPRKGQGSGRERFYLSGRSQVFEPEKEAAQVFTYKNQGLSPIKLQRMRSLKDGEILALSWDGDGLQEEWKTEPQDGHFRDLALGDLNNDGVVELAALLVKKEGLIMFSNPLSQVLIFPLQGKQGE
ncbi:MAG: FG-GAP-like repeat-containing protein [Desulfohalobiaceae bacterium]